MSNRIFAEFPNGGTRIAIDTGAIIAVGNREEGKTAVYVAGQELPFVIDLPFADVMTILRATPPQSAPHGDRCGAVHTGIDFWECPLPAGHDGPHDGPDGAWSA